MSAAPAQPAASTRPPGRAETSAGSRQRRRRTAGDWGLLALAVAVGLVIISPFILILINSFKSPADYSNGGPLSLPRHLYLNGLKVFWQQVDYPQKVENSILISGLVAIFAVTISVLNAYAVGIGRIRGRTWIVVLFLLANVLPQEALLYPLYIMFKTVGLYDTVWSIVIIFTVVQSAFGTYLLSSVYGTFPRELLEAARLDGASRWNEFLLPLTFLVSNSHQTVQVGVATLQGERIMDVTTTSASALLGVIPTLVFFLIFQRTLTRGITAGAVK
jgi:raffinose/stachyose/melibiose transport system permease protein